MMTPEEYRDMHWDEDPYGYEDECEYDSYYDEDEEEDGNR